MHVSINELKLQGESCSSHHSTKNSVKMRTCGWILCFTLLSLIPRSNQETVVESDLNKMELDNEITAKPLRYSKRFRFSGSQRCTDILFRKNMYTFVVVNGRTFGRIGKVQAISKSGKPITYKLLSYHPFVRIDKSDGSIELNYKRSTRYSPKRSQVTTFRVAANSLQNSRCKSSRCRRCQSNSWVRIVAVRAYYGDNIIRSLQGKLSSLITTNHLCGRKISAESLHRVVRWISPKMNVLSTKISLAQARLDNACSRLAWTVKSHFKKRFPSVIVSASMKHLFSPATVRKLLVLSNCPERRVDHSFCRIRAKYRSIDGTCNNIRSPLYGSSSSAFTRLLPAKYYDPDGFKDPLGSPDLPNAPDVPHPLEITKQFVIIQKHSSPVKKVHSHFLMQWGQFLDHDFTLAPESENADKCRLQGCHKMSKAFEPPCFTILPHKSSKCIHFTRTAGMCNRYEMKLGPREQMNANTAFIDGSQIYGSTLELAQNLRNLSPNRGLLKVRRFSHGDLMPLDSAELMFPNDLCRKTGGCFLAGDTRSSEQMGLAAVHTLFAREHNRIARKLLQINPHWTGDIVYEETKKIVGGILQKITYEDFLPALFGSDPLRKYSGYKYWVNPGIINSVAAAAYRFGHSTIRPSFDILDENHRKVGAPIPLKHMFFNNTYIHRHGIDHLLLGLCTVEAEQVDRSFAEGVMNHLFERKHSPGLNLIALNIQRGRDHGLPAYNDFRRYCRLSDARTFEDTAKEISAENRKILAKLYHDDPTTADLFVAGIAETPLPGSQLGPTFSCLIKEQFARLRDGDRFFYRRGKVFTKSQLNEIKKSSLSRILCDNLKVGKKLTVQQNAFQAVNEGVQRIPCTSIPKIDLNHWKELRA